jgi:hypothetical protein
MSRSGNGNASRRATKKAREYCAAYDADLKADYDKRKAWRDEFAEENGS